MDMADLNPALPIFRAVVERNLGRARRRYLRACGTQTENGDTLLGNGDIIRDPSDDEPIPVEKDSPLTLPPPCDIVHCIKHGAQMDVKLPDDQVIPWVGP